jgi:hypothetical protein
VDIRIALIMFVRLRLRAKCVQVMQAVPVVIPIVLMALVKILFKGNLAPVTQIVQVVIPIVILSLGAAQVLALRIQNVTRIQTAQADTVIFGIGITIAILILALGHGVDTVMAVGILRLIVLTMHAALRLKGHLVFPMPTVEAPLSTVLPMPALQVQMGLRVQLRQTVRAHIRCA